jgi:hypothetical protein
MTKRAFIRCNGGDYFQGEYCPLDNWSSAESKELAAITARLTAEGQEVSIAGLRKVGVSETTIKRTIVIDFGSDASVFEAISPQGFVVNGKWKLLRQAGLDFH